MYVKEKKKSLIFSAKYTYMMHDIGKDMMHDIGKDNLSTFFNDETQ